MLELQLLHFYSCLATWDSSPYFPQTKLLLVELGSVKCTGFVNVSQHLMQTLQQRTPFGWQIQQVEKMEQAIDLVELGATWCIVAIDANASCQLDHALVQGNRSSIPVAHVIYDQGRQSAFVDTVVGMVSNAIYNCSAAMSQLLIDAAFNKQLNVSRNAAPIVAAPLQMSMKNLHPTLYPGLGVATTLGLIVLMILAGSVVGSTTATFSPLLFKVPPVHLVLMRPLYAVWLSSQVALIMTTIITLFGTPVAKGFVMLWLFLWLCMHCFISTNALIIIAIGLQFSGFVIAVYTFLSMSCSQFSLPIEFSPEFFKMGYAMPLFHAVQGARHIIFGSYNQILMNTLVLLAYTIVFMILIPIVFWSKILINKYHCISKLQLMFVEPFMNWKWY